MARIDAFLQLLVEQKGSDLHFHAGHVPTIRYQGELIDVPFRSLSAEETKLFLNEMMTEAQAATLEARREVDFAYAVPGLGRFRVNVYTQSRGLGAVFRGIAEKVPTVAQLRVPAAIVRLITLASGLVLITGPTGSGKTTTLSALVDEMNHTQSRHVITIEDPIEIVHTADLCAITQRELHTHSSSWSAALRAALREAPDVLVVGELRDYDSISLALAAAETGILVLGTLHTNSASKALDRLLGACPEDAHVQVLAVLANVLKGVVAQQLLTHRSGSGRVAAHEVLLSDSAVANFIRDGRFHQLEAHLKTQELGSSGMQSLDQSLLSLVRGGVVTMEEAISFASDPEGLRRGLEQFQRQLEGGTVSLRALGCS